ncbi:unnamed protein product [Aphanomyces euteiches]|nr:hypothetical protein AeRB84_020850 [Aphanomyces euteiches]
MAPEPSKAQTADQDDKVTLLEESLPLDAEDQPYYDVVKDMCGGDTPSLLCIRLARAYRSEKLQKRRMAKTVNEAKRILDWRREQKADEILSVTLENTQLFKQCWPSTICGEDSYGHVVSVERAVDIDIAKLQANFTLDEVISHRVQYLERLQVEMQAASTRNGRRIYKHICIFDLSGVGLKHIAPKVINYFQPIFSLGQQYYPESLHRLYLINAPFVFWGAWKVIQTFIDPETRDKIQIFKTTENFLSTAQQHGLPLSSFPSSLGGSYQAEKTKPTA